MCLTTADIPSAPKGIQGQLGWSPGQSDLVPDLEAANSAHSRELKLSNLWGLFPSKPFYGATILWTRAWGDELCSRSVRGYTREGKAKRTAHHHLKVMSPRLPPIHLWCSAFMLRILHFWTVSMSSLWSTGSHTSPPRENFCALFRAFLFFSSSCMYAKGKKKSRMRSFFSSHLRHSAC